MRFPPYPSLGSTPIRPKVEMATGSAAEEDIYEALEEVIDPELGLDDLLESFVDVLFCCASCRHLNLGPDWCRSQRRIRGEPHGLSCLAVAWRPLGRTSPPSR